MLSGWFKTFCKVGTSAHIASSFFASLFSYNVDIKSGHSLQVKWILVLIHQGIDDRNFIWGLHSHPRTVKVFVDVWSRLCGAHHLHCLCIGTSDMSGDKPFRGSAPFRSVKLMIPPWLLAFTSPRLCSRARSVGRNTVALALGWSTDHKGSTLHLAVESPAFSSQPRKQKCTWHRCSSKYGIVSQTASRCRLKSASRPEKSEHDVCWLPSPWSCPRIWMLRTGICPLPETAWTYPGCRWFVWTSPCPWLGRCAASLWYRGLCLIRPSTGSPDSDTTTVLTWGRQGFDHQLDSPDSLETSDEQCHQHTHLLPSEAAEGHHTQIAYQYWQWMPWRKKLNTCTICHIKLN